MITEQLVREVFYFDKEVGKLYWKKPTSKRVKKGEEIKTLDRHGYYKVGLNNKEYLVHRVVWLYVYGYYPENLIDHIDGNKLNNKIENLREANKFCNSLNSKTRKDNTSNIRGVYFDKNNKKWYAQIKDNKRYFLGYYDSYDEAVCARFAAEQCLKWEVCNKSSAHNYVLSIINK